MISLPNIIKGIKTEERVLEYAFERTFDDIIKAAKEEEEEHLEELAVEEFVDHITSVTPEQMKALTDKLKEEAEIIYKQASDAYEEATRRSEEILLQAREEAARLLEEARENGYREGYEAGLLDGTNKAYEDHKSELNLHMDEFKLAVKTTIESITVEKDKLLDKYIDDLKKITLTIAEKVIQTSLKSSGEIIKRMIVGAAGKLKKNQWVKIYVSQKDAGMMIQGDVGLLNELSHISGNIKIIAMDHAEDGSCIIELPEEIIDVSVNTQIENIKGILNNARL